jgi:hypothetical protein
VSGRVGKSLRYPRYLLNWYADRADEMELPLHTLLMGVQEAYHVIITGDWSGVPTERTEEVRRIIADLQAPVPPHPPLAPLEAPVPRH